MTRDGEISEAEDRVRWAATELAAAEDAMAAEYLRQVALGKSSWEAQRAAELDGIHAVRLSQAQYEIALERLRRLR